MSYFFVFLGGTFFGLYLSWRMNLKTDPNQPEAKPSDEPPMFGPHV